MGALAGAFGAGSTLASELTISHHTGIREFGFGCLSVFPPFPFWGVIGWLPVPSWKLRVMHTCARSPTPPRRLPTIPQPNFAFKPIENYSLELGLHSSDFTAHFKYDCSYWKRQNLYSFLVIRTGEEAAVWAYSFRLNSVYYAPHRSWCSPCWHHGCCAGPPPCSKGP